MGEHCYNKFVHEFNGNILANGSNFFFEGESIYSYGYHFEAGRIVRNKRGEKAYLINSIHYSSTTSKHQYFVRNAIPTDSKVFSVGYKIFHDGDQFKHDLVLDVNGHRWAFNRYENDILTAGCHRIAYSEMEGVARQLGWD